MLHKIINWSAGYVRIRLPAVGSERFVNLCRNAGIYLWGLRWTSDGQYLYAYMKKRDYFKIRPLVRKTRTVPLVTKRVGGVFWLQRAGRRASFWCGVSLFLVMLLFLADRIWGIYIEGQSYHTRESILAYLEENDIYGGIRSCYVPCSDIEARIRQDFPDIGWASIEKSGSKLYVRLQEVVLIEDEEEPEPGSLVADRAGRIVSIVTSQGKAKVRAGERVKKGQVLISGRIQVIGDNEEVVGRTNVHAEGTVVLESKMAYTDTLEKNYSKKIRTGRELSVYQFRFGRKDIFLYNPLNYLESYEKYDIIREGGLLCPFLSLRFPVSVWKKTHREIRYEEASYSQKEAEDILQARYDYYLKQLKEQGFTDLSGKLKVTEQGDVYQADGTVKGRREQQQYKELPVKKFKRLQHKTESE